MDGAPGPQRGAGRELALMAAGVADRAPSVARRWPLTGAQQGVWLAQALAPEHPIYNTADAIELTGPVDAPALAAHIRAVVDAAEALHVRFADGPDGPMQIARTDRDWDLPVVDLRGEADPQSAADAIMRADLGTAVDLERGRLFHTALLRTGDEHWTWYLRIHHIATDAYATALLVRRVAERVASSGDAKAAAVDAAALGSVSAPVDAADAPAALNLGDLSSLVEADAAYRASPEHQADRVFWAERLRGHEPPATIASAGLGAAATATRAAAPAAAVGPVRASRTIAAEHASALGRAAATLDAGWPELLIAGAAANLHSLTGARRQVFAMPVLSRAGAIRRTPGIAVNIVPLVTEVDPAAPLADLVGAVRDELRATRRHQRLRFEAIARMLPAGVPLFGPQINLKPYVSTFQLGEATALVRNLATGPVDDLSLIATPLPDGALSLSLDGNPARYDLAAVEAQLTRLVTTLEACAEPGALDRPAGALPTITPAERTQVVETFNATAHPVDTTTLTARFLEQVRATPDLVAVSDDHETLTYAELHARAATLATDLRARGAGPDAIVGLELTRSVGLSVAVVAVLLAGAAYLPIDPELPAERIAFMLEDASPTCVIREADVAAASAATDRTAPPASFPLPSPTDAAYVIYTSGSTGRPKGVITEHAAIVNRLAWMQHALPIGPGDTVLQKTPYGFDVSVWELTWPLLQGARIAMAQPGGHRDPAYLAETIQREQVTVAHFVPSMLDLFLDEPTAADCTSLRHVVCSGEALPETTVARYHRCLSAPLHNLYGPTEAAIDVTSWRCAPSDPAGPIPIGRPIWNTHTYVLDEAQRPVPVGATGELWLAGANLAREYLGRPELTAERFVPEPFTTGDAGGATAAASARPGRPARMYRTGDLARWRADGAIDYLGRTDDQVKLRGLRIELGEIEATLAAHPAIARAAASVDRTAATPRIVAHLVAVDPAALPSPAELADHAGITLPDYMIPSALAFVDDLPLSPNGKLDRRRLPAIEAARAGQRDAPAGPPASPREQQLCDLFGAALGTTTYGPQDHLFDHGGDSLLAARLAANIRAQLGVPLSLGALFAAPTPAALAARIDDGRDLAALEPLLTLRAHGDAPPLFCIHPAGGLGWCYAGLTRTIQDRPILALQAPGVTGSAMPQSLDDLATHYADLIEVAQPDGPCHLLGWSVGGDLAHATAVALQARGRETGVVALLDAYPGEQWTSQPPPTPDETRIALLHMGGLDESALGGAEPSLDHVLEALAREGSALASLGATTFGHVAEVVITCSRLMREHHTQPLAGDLLFFEATAPRREDWLDATAWQRHVTGTVTTHAVDCTHPEMPRRGPIDAIGARVAEALATYERAAKSSEASRSTTSTGAPVSTTSDPT